MARACILALVVFSLNVPVSSERRLVSIGPSSANRGNLADVFVSIPLTDVLGQWPDPIRHHDSGRRPRGRAPDEPGFGYGETVTFRNRIRSR